LFCSINLSLADLEKLIFLHLDSSISLLYAEDPQVYWMFKKARAIFRNAWSNIKALSLDS
jgi:hypothetical protein